MAKKSATAEERIRKHEDQIKLLKARQAYEAARNAIKKK
jgi:hypothetical protein